MAGVNDPVFRAICRRLGAGITYTEMISAKGLAYGNLKTQEMITALQGDKPYAVQLFGDDPQIMAAEAHKLALRLKDDLALIDINMGCPARKVTSTGSGAALLQKPKLAASIVTEVSSAVVLPVTVKMRLVCKSNDIRTLSFAEDMVASGAQAITIHGRTAEQFYTGRARKDIAGALVRHLEIPIFASGDVCTQDDIQEYWSLGVNAVLAARGARGNPWIFSGHKPSIIEIAEVAREHTVGLYEFEPRKLVWMRKHLAWYFKGSPEALKIRKAVQTAVSLEDYLVILDEASRR